MEKIYTSLGLMSGTSMDGVDASIISSFDGIQYDEAFNRYFEYDKALYKKLSSLRDIIFTSKDLKKYSNEIKIQPANLHPRRRFWGGTQILLLQPCKDECIHCVGS